MPELRPQPQDVMIDKLEQLKCSQNCQNIANYLIYGYGIYCTQCLSQVKDLNPQKIVNFAGLSKILVQLIQQYDKNTKSEVSYVKVAKTETDKEMALINKLRKNLEFQVSESRKKCNSILNEGYKSCLQEHRLQQLESLYQPDMTATMIMKETDILIKNLQILKIQQKSNNQFEYKFVDESKNPKKASKKSSQQYSKACNVLKESSQKLQDILFIWRQNKQKK